MPKSDGPQQETVSTYLAALPSDKRRALENLRRIIARTVRAAEECLVYGVPGFRVHGRSLVCYAAFANHCGFYPRSESVIKGFAKELKPFETSKGTIRFLPTRPLPTAPVTKIVKARLAEITAK